MQNGVESGHEGGHESRQASEAARQLGRMVYFAGLTPLELEDAAQALSPVEVKAGEAVFAQGEEGAWVYLLARGAVEVSIEVPAPGSGSTSRSTSEAGIARRVLASLRPPAMLGEMSVLLDEPGSATATATSDSVLWQVSREEVRRALETNQKWAQRLLLAMSKILAARLTEANRHVATLASQRGRPLSDDELSGLQQSLFAAE